MQYKNYVVTGCLGFIGSHFVRHILNTHDDISVVGISRMSNQKNLKRLADIMDKDKRFNMYYADFSESSIPEAFQDAEVVVHAGAKTFVDYSIQQAMPFIKSNVIGTYMILEEMRKSKSLKRYIQVSTDEVYGAILQGAYKEDARLNPTNPYAASKAGADMLVLSYFNTYGIPSIITRTENNYGILQGKEKAIPTFVSKALNNEPLPIFGDGLHSRMWLHVEDHCSGISHLIEHGKPGEIYHIAGHQELQNIELAKMILRLLGKPGDMIKFIPDYQARPGHDRRYALNTDKIRATGWKPKWGLSTGIVDVVTWYSNNKWWLEI